MTSCKLIHRFIIITLTVIVMQTGAGCAGCASDGGGEIPPPKIPDTTAGMFVQESLKAADAGPVEPQMPDKMPEVPEEKVTPEKPAEHAEADVDREEATAPPEQETRPAQKDGFMASVMKMLNALVKTVFLILLLFAGVLLYKHLKNRKLTGAAKTGHKVTEPRTVSEAVSSYVRHKIKKNA